MSGLTRDSPQISASPHQLDLAPYASKPYNAQWNTPGLLRDMHTLRSSRILGEMEVDEPWLVLWIPLNYQVDMGASQHRTLVSWEGLDCLRDVCILKFDFSCIVLKLCIINITYRLYRLT